MPGLRISLYSGDIQQERLLSRKVMTDQQCATTPRPRNQCYANCGLEPQELSCERHFRTRYIGAECSGKCTFGAMYIGVYILLDTCMRMTGGRQNYSMLEPGVCDVIWRCSNITLFVSSYLIAGLDDDPWTALRMWEKRSSLCLDLGPLVFHRSSPLHSSCPCALSILVRL